MPETKKFKKLNRVVFDTCNKLRGIIKLRFSLRGFVMVKPRIKFNGWVWRVSQRPKRTNGLQKAWWHYAEEFAYKKNLRMGDV